MIGLLGWGLCCVDRYRGLGVTLETVDCCGCVLSMNVNETLFVDLICADGADDDAVG